MESVALKARRARDRRVGRRRARRLGARRRRRRRCASTSPIGPDLRLVGRGPALFAEDQRVLERVRRRGANRLRGPGAERRGRARRATLADRRRQRTALLAAVGHDLRTPLAGIKAAVSTLRQTDVEWSDEERDELLATIEDSADRLDGVVAQPARREPAAGRGAERADSRRSRSTRSSSAALLALPDAAERVAVDVPEDLPLVQRRPRPARAGAGQRARQRAAPRRPATGRSRSSRTPAAPTARSSRSSTTGPGVAAERASGCSSRSSGSTTASRRGRTRPRPSPAASSRRWAARWSPTTTPGGGLTMRIRLALARAGAAAGAAMTRVLVVDDEPRPAAALGINLRARGYEVDARRATGRAALDRGLAASRPTSSSSTSACPTWTGSR